MLFSLFPAYTQITLQLYLHFVLSGIFMFMYLKIITNEKIAALLGAIMWVFSGLFIYRTGHINIIQSVSYMPLFFFISEKFIRENKAVYLLLTAPLITVSIFIGQLQSTFYILLALAVYTLFRAVQEKRNIIKTIGVTALSYALGAGMSLIQTIPTMELISNSSRSGGMNINDILGSGTFKPVNLINMLFPYLFGSTQNNTFIGTQAFGFWTMSYMAIYTGCIFAVVIIISLFTKKTPVFMKFIAAILSAAFLFSLGANFFLNKYIVMLPGFNLFRNPVRMAEIFAFFSVIFAVCFLASAKSEDIRPKAPLILCYILGAGAAVSAVIFAFSGLILKIAEPKITQVITNSVLNTPFHNYDVDYYFLKFTSAFVFIIRHVFFQSLFAAAAAACVYLFSVKKINRDKMITVIAAVTIIELTVNGFNFNETIKTSYYTSVPHTAEFLQKRPERPVIMQWDYYRNDARIYKYGYAKGSYEEHLKKRDMIQPNLSLFYGITSYIGYDPLGYGDYFKYTDEFQTANYSGDIGLLKKNRKTLDHTGVNFILSPVTLKLEGLELVYNKESVNIYKNIHARDSVYFSGDIKDKNDYSRTEEFKILKWEGGEVAVQAKNNRSGYTVIMTRYYPGWKAYVNGKEEKIEKAYPFFCGVKTPAGESLITLKYTPVVFKTGAILSLLFAVLFCAAFFYFRKK
ncbi:MAG TPA: YfhO family protein [Candidatus Goldiibacteriota bacterium]|nr:YfhO family protein [Candidatus Goldiibacteriota bacterium]HPN63845.1 YfhO family protein [Candidatus Goldiibacteriota bacterium]HRQ43047.1 YfhO family protein [Candidatus Goldiibacteriota bacterium]